VWQNRKVWTGVNVTISNKTVGKERERSFSYSTDFFHTQPLASRLNHPINWNRIFWDQQKITQDHWSVAFITRLCWNRRHVSYSPDYSVGFDNTCWRSTDTFDAPHKSSDAMLSHREQFVREIRFSENPRPVRSFKCVGTVLGSDSVIAGSRRQFFEADLVLPHDLLLLEKQNCLYSQNQQLKQSHYRQVACKFGDLPLYIYGILTLLCVAIVFWGAGLVVNGNCLAWRACGVLLIIFAAAGWGSIECAILYGNPLVFWGLGDAKDCQGEHGKHDGGLFHGESVLALENYTLPVIPDQNTGLIPSS